MTFLKPNLNIIAQLHIYDNHFQHLYQRYLFLIFVLSLSFRRFAMSTTFPLMVGLVYWYHPSLLALSTDICPHGLPSLLVSFTLIGFSTDISHLGLSCLLTSNLMVCLVYWHLPSWLALSTDICSLRLPSLLVSLPLVGLFYCHFSFWLNLSAIY